jgi:hypothetical protein
MHAIVTVITAVGFWPGLEMQNKPTVQKQKDNLEP